MPMEETFDYRPAEMSPVCSWTPFILCLDNLRQQIRRRTRIFHADLNLQIGPETTRFFFNFFMQFPQYLSNLVLQSICALLLSRDYCEFSQGLRWFAKPTKVARANFAGRLDGNGLTVGIETVVGKRRSLYPSRSTSPPRKRLIPFP